MQHIFHHEMEKDAATDWLNFVMYLTIIYLFVSIAKQSYGI